MVYRFFDKKTSGSGVKSMPQNEQLSEELRKPIIEKFKKRKVYHFRTIFGVLIYYALLIFLVNMLGFFL